MPNQTSLEQIEIGELTQAVDDARLAADPFKLSAGLRTLLDTRLADLKDEGYRHVFDRGWSSHRVSAGPWGA